MKIEKSQELVIAFKNVPDVTAEKLAEELESRLRRAHEGIQVKRIKSNPDTQGLGDLLVVMVQFVDGYSEHVQVLINHAIIMVLMDFLVQKGVDIELKICDIIRHININGKMGNAKQQVGEFLKSWGKKSDSEQEEEKPTSKEKESD
ncbi:MAG: hypothetical protein BWK78_05630 [Thiotrichaceae bacterium IS1]|nr:MAG: hypothetical protein BWK78_05630 [Thiotrichaceae bacterium IS1]